MILSMASLSRSLGFALALLAAAWGAAQALDSGADRIAEIMDVTLGMQVADVGAGDGERSEALVSQSISSPTTNPAIDAPDHTSVVAETTAQGVVAKYLEAIGGVGAIRAVVSKQITYRVHMFGRDPYLMERSWSRPGSMKTGRPGAGTYTLTEGEKSWRVSPEGREQMPPAVARSMSKLADIDGPLVDPGKKGVELTYSGLVRYDMTDLHQVTATFADGVQWEFFFDASSGLLRRMTRPSFLMLNGQISRGPDSHYFYYDYRPVGSVLYPHIWIQGAEDHTHLFVVEEFQVPE
jgi:hypothetical protein